MGTTRKFYFASKHVDFQTNDFRTEGTYQKYASIDDKTDGFFYYTRYIKFGVGRAMIDLVLKLGMDI